MTYHVSSTFFIHPLSFLPSHFIHFLHPSFYPVFSIFPPLLPSFILSSILFHPFSLLYPSFFLPSCFLHFPLYPSLLTSSFLPACFIHFPFNPSSDILLHSVFLPSFLQSFLPSYFIHFLSLLPSFHPASSIFPSILHTFFRPISSLSSSILPSSFFLSHFIHFPLYPSSFLSSCFIHFFLYPLSYVPSPFILSSTHLFPFQTRFTVFFHRNAVMDYDVLAYSDQRVFSFLFLFFNFLISRIWRKFQTK